VNEVNGGDTVFIGLCVLVSVCACAANRPIRQLGYSKRLKLRTSNLIKYCQSGYDPLDFFWKRGRDHGHV